MGGAGAGAGPGTGTLPFVFLYSCGKKWGGTRTLQVRIETQPT